MSKYSNRQTGNKRLKPHSNLKLTPEVQATICDWISKGNYISKACEAAGISKQTFYNWIMRADKGEQPFVDMLDSFKKAEAQASVERIARIQEAAKGGIPIRRKTITRKDGSIEVEESYAAPQWQADAWTSERKEPQEWGRVDRVQLRHTMDPETIRYNEAMANHPGARLAVPRLIAESRALEGECREIPEGDEEEQ